jgi:hypothetical protein
MSQALMFTFLPNNLGSSNVIKLAMYFIQFLYSVCCAHTHTQNCVALTGNMNCRVFYAFEKERFIAFEAHGRICVLHGSGKHLTLVLKKNQVNFLYELFG